MRKIKFKATKVFQEVHTAIKSGKYKLIIEEGSSRSSKTWSNFQILFLEMFETPMTKVTVLRDTQKSCRDIVEDDWKKWLKDPKGRVKEYELEKITVEQLDKFLKDERLDGFFVNNKTNHTWTLPNGSFIVFTGLDDVDNAMGMAQSICWINEPYKFAKDVFNQLSQRTSKYIIVDWNPKQNHWIDKEKAKATTFTHYSTFEDNPFCPIKSKLQIWGYQPLKWFSGVVSKQISEDKAKDYDVIKNELNFTPKQLKELARCIYNESVGSADEYHWLVFGLGLKAEKPNKIYRGWSTITNAEFDRLKNKEKLVCHFGLDYGFVNPSACVEVLWNGENAFYLREKLYEPIDEIRKRGSTLGDELIKVGVPTGNNHYIFGDSSDKDARNNESVGADLRTNYSLNVVPVNKPGYVERFDFISKCKIFYTEESSNIEFEYENYEREVINGQQMEWPVKKDDHILDGISYCVMMMKKIYKISL